MADAGPGAGPGAGQSPQEFFQGQLDNLRSALTNQQVQHDRLDGLVKQLSHDMNTRVSREQKRLWFVIWFLSLVALVAAVYVALPSPIAEVQLQPILRASKDVFSTTSPCNEGGFRPVGVSVQVTKPGRYMINTAARVINTEEVFFAPFMGHVLLSAFKPNGCVGKCSFLVVHDVKEPGIVDIRACIGYYNYKASPTLVEISLEVIPITVL